MKSSMSGFEEWFRSLVEGTTAALFVVSGDRVAFVNRAAGELLGRLPRELQRARFSEFLHPADLGLFGRMTRRAAQGEVPVQRLRMLRGGQLRWVEASVRQVDLGGARALLVTAFDVTRFRRTELAQRDQEARLRLVQRAGRTVTWDLRIASDTLDISGLPRDAGTSSSDHLLTTSGVFFECVHADDLAGLRTALQRTLEDGSPIVLEFRVRPPGGELYWVAARGRRVLDRSGKPAHLVGVATDITQRRKAEEALFRERELAEAMMASVSEGVIRVDAKGRVEHLSSAAARLLGRSPKEVRGCPLTDVVELLRPETRSPLDPLASERRRKDGALYPQRCLLVTPTGGELDIRFYVAETRTRSGRRTGAVLVLKDLAEAHAAEHGMAYLTTHDALTDLLNRRELEKQLRKAMQTAREEDRSHAFCLLDLDGFKLINHACGHLAGDQMLRRFAGFLKQRVRETDFLARIGGDEFGVLLHNCTSERARLAVEYLQRDLRNFQFSWQDRVFEIGVSMGLVPVDARNASVDEILQAADAACELAKEEGGNRVHEYRIPEARELDPKVPTGVNTEIRDALDEGRFVLYCQSIRRLRGPQTEPELYELFLRMIDEHGVLRMPGTFLPRAERQGLAVEIDRWVVREVIRTLGMEGHPAARESVCLAVNLSGPALSDETFLDFVLREVEGHGVPWRRLCFEVTEKAVLGNLDGALRVMSVLRGRGCRFLLDDFGTGMSSFAYLRSVPVDFIKIDGQVVRDLLHDPTQRALVEAIRTVASGLELTTIAESVEDERTLDALVEAGIDMAQGHWISRPEPLSDLGRRTSSESKMSH